jgi:hypothetical protein
MGLNQATNQDGHHANLWQKKQRQINERTEFKHMGAGAGMAQAADDYETT